MKKSCIATGVFPLALVCCYLKADVKIEGGLSYFLPSSHRVREIYEDGGLNYHLNLSQTIFSHCDLWLGANYFSQYGHSLAGDQRTRIRIIPVSLGLKYFFPIKIRRMKGDFYLNGAFKYYFVKIHDESDFVDSHTSKNGLGGVLGFGTYLYLSRHVFLNFLVDYSIKTFHASHPHKPNTEGHSLNVGGWDFGGGIGLRF